MYKETLIYCKDAYMCTETLIYCKGCEHVHRNVDLL